ncbi:Afadin [Lamellibrachia satsuma]|nr:Afadin [Lamellibrachia satsuma]
MAQRVKEEELQRLKRQIKEWNENRLDLFELSQPNEGSEFHGVMRFFFQDEGAKVATKCIRVSSTATTSNVLETLIEKFRPDMRMLSMPRYSLYEVHVNGEERKLQLEERPLYVQLNWGKDDREGRFLLKNEDSKTVPLHSGVYSEADQSLALSPEGSGFKRKLSKREKKEKKKLEKEAKLRGKENETPKAKNGVAQKLYNELPETSFTRSISNPEAVMKRRRQMKLEKKLQQFKSRDGGPDTGGTLKIYGDSVKPDVPYKTLLLSTGDTVAYVVRETLEKYGLEREDSSNYCLVQVIVPPSGHEYHGGSSRSEEFILNDDDCPLALLMQHPPSQGTIMFQLRRRTEMPKKKKKRSSSSSRLEHGLSPEQRPPGPDRLPFLVELNPDGSESYQRGKVVLPINVTEVGSEQCMNGHYLQLYGPDILPKHCVLAHMEGIVTATPASQDADSYVNNQRIYETTVLQHGALLRFGKRHMFRFYDPGVLESGGQRPMSGEPMSKKLGPPLDARMEQSAADLSNFETTFDVDGHIETVTREEKPPLSPGPEDLLPAMLEFREEGEDAFLAAVISEVNGAAVQYKLAPTYTLYMAIRYRIARVSHPNLRMAERAHWIASLVSKIANMVHQTIQESVDSPGALSFWMANASELLHFVKHDRQLQGAPHIMEAQDSLAEAVQLAFSHLVDCLQEELANAMPAFLEESLRDLDADDDETPVNIYPPDKPTLGRWHAASASVVSIASYIFAYLLQKYHVKPFTCLYL